MRWLAKFRLRLRSLFDTSRVESDLDDELRDYLDREIECAIADGVSPDEARRLALASLDGADRLKEACRDARGVRWLLETLTDVRFAIRTLRKAPAFAAIVVLALALCIGANTAIFSVVDTVLFRPLPFPGQDRLVAVTEGVPGLGFPVMPFSCPDYLFVAANNTSFSATGTYRTQSYEFSGVGGPRRVNGARLTASLFGVLEISPAVGRSFSPAEDEHAKRVAVLTDAFARAAFGAPVQALGRTVLLDRAPYTIIGVMPRAFSFPIRGSRFNNDPADVFVPVSWNSEDRQQNVSSFDYSMVARLKPNVTIPQASGEMRGLLKRIVDDYPPKLRQALLQNPNFSLESRIVPFHEEFTGNVQRPLLLLLGAVAVVLLIGCADVANLIFTRTVGRQREFALRTALGASGWRLARQTVTEGLVLSVAGGAIGIGAALWALPLLVRLAPDDLPRLGEVGVNARMLLFVLAITLATPFLFSLGPLAGIVRSALGMQLRGEGRNATHNRRRRRMMSAAVVVQFSLAFLLLTIAGLLTRSLIRSAEANPGFRPAHLISARIALPDTAYQSTAQVDSIFNRLLDRLSTLPGVLQTGAISNIPLGSSSNVVISMEGHGTVTEKTDMLFCRGSALESLGVSLVRGHLLRPEDQIANKNAAVISQTLAKRAWPNEDPIGRRFRFGVEMPNKTEPWQTVVGVVADVKARLTSDSPRSLIFMTPPDWVKQMNVVVRTSSDPALLANVMRREIAQLDPNLPLDKVETLDQVLHQTLAAERFRTWLLVCFAVAALVLATLGIAGLLAYNVAQRTREFGVRMALGANRRDLLALVFHHCLRLSGAGIVVGLAASFAVTRALSALLYDTSPLDPGTFLAVPVILLLVALAAALVPAWRVFCTDPVTTLRAE
jgi:predicted permease